MIVKDFCVTRVESLLLLFFVYSSNYAVNFLNPDNISVIEANEKNGNYTAKYFINVYSSVFVTLLI